MHKPSGILAGIASLGLVATCGSGGGGGGGSIPLDELPPRLAQALCTAYQNCYGPIFELFLGGTDCVAVTEQRIRNGTFPMLAGEIALGMVAYD